MAIPGLIAAVALLAGAPAGADCAPGAVRHALERPRDPGRASRDAGDDTLELPSHPLLTPGRRGEPLPAVLVNPTRVARPYRSSPTVTSYAATEGMGVRPRPSRGPPAY